MPPPPRMHKPKTTIILKIVVNSKNDTEIGKKAFQVCRAFRDESIDA